MNNSYVPFSFAVVILHFLRFLNWFSCIHLQFTWSNRFRHKNAIKLTFYTVLICDRTFRRIHIVSKSHCHKTICWSEVYCTNEQFTCITCIYMCHKIFHSSNINFSVEDPLEHLSTTSSWGIRYSYFVFCSLRDSAILGEHTPHEESLNLHCSCSATGKLNGKLVSRLDGWSVTCFLVRVCIQCPVVSPVFHWSGLKRLITTEVLLSLWFSIRRLFCFVWTCRMLRKCISLCLRITEKWRKHDN